MRRIAIGLFLVAMLGCGGGARPDVVVVVLDTLRPDHLGFHGYERETAPFLAQLASRSVVFEEAVSTSSWTAPSTASLFTSLHPLRHGVRVGMVAHSLRDAPGVTLNRLAEDATTLPERFAALGYRCFGIATNPNIGPEIGFSRGFHRFQRIQDVPVDRARDDEAIGAEGRWRWGNAEELHVLLAAWRRELRDSRPYFLYLHFNDPHDPYHVRRPWFEEPRDPGERPRAAYDSEIGYADAVLARIYRELDLAENAIVVVVSDHGEAFGEHGRRHHHRGLYRELNRILLMVSAPSLGVRPRVVSERVSILGVLPTLLELLGEPVPPGLDGWSLAPILLGSDEAGPLARRLQQRVLVAHREEIDPREPPTWAVLRGPWTLIREGGRSELYDVVADPGQRHDRADERREVRVRLESELADFRERVGDAPSERVEIEVDSRTAEGLEALGYVDDGQQGAGARPSTQRR